MIKRFIVLACFFVAGMVLGLAATNLLAPSLATPEAAPAQVPHEGSPLPSRVDRGRTPQTPVGIEASLGQSTVVGRQSLFRD